MDGRNAECGSPLPPLLFHPWLLLSLSLSIFPFSFSLSRGQSEELLIRDLGRDDAKGLGSVFPILDRHGGMIHDVVDG